MVDETKEIYGGGMKRCSRQYQERKMHTRWCLLRRIGTGIEAYRQEKKRKHFRKQ